MARTDPFEITDASSLDADAFVATIPAGLTTKNALLQTLYERARLPG